MRQEIINLTNEWNSKKGLVTCEFSLSKNRLKEFLSYVSEVEVINGKWVYYECDACGKDYYHVEIIIM